MQLSDHDALIVIAALKWAAMEHDRQAKAMIGWGRTKEAAQPAHFSKECARLAEEFEKQTPAARLGKIL